MSDLDAPKLGGHRVRELARLYEEKAMGSVRDPRLARQGSERQSGGLRAAAGGGDGRGPRPLQRRESDSSISSGRGDHSPPRPVAHPLQPRPLLERSATAASAASLHRKNAMDGRPSFARSSTLSDVLAHRQARAFLRQFVEAERSEENLLFWEEVNRYHVALRILEERRRRAAGGDEPLSPATFDTYPQLLRLAHKIFQAYIPNSAPRAVNLPHEAVQAVELALAARDLLGVSKALLEAQNVVVELMQRDTFPRFANSPRFDALLAAAPTFDPMAPEDPDLVVASAHEELRRSVEGDHARQDSFSRIDLLHRLHSLRSASSDLSLPSAAAPGTPQGLSPTGSAAGASSAAAPAAAVPSPPHAAKDATLAPPAAAAPRRDSVLRRAASALAIDPSRDLAHRRQSSAAVLYAPGLAGDDESVVEEKERAVATVGAGADAGGVARQRRTRSRSVGSGTLDEEVTRAAARAAAGSESSPKLDGGDSDDDIGAWTRAPGGFVRERRRSSLDLLVDSQLAERREASDLQHRLLLREAALRRIVESEAAYVEHLRDLARLGKECEGRVDKIGVQRERLCVLWGNVDEILNIHTAVLTALAAPRSDHVRVLSSFADSFTAYGHYVVNFGVAIEALFALHTNAKFTSLVPRFTKLTVFELPQLLAAPLRRLRILWRTVDALERSTRLDESESQPAAQTAAKLRRVLAPLMAKAEPVAHILRVAALQAELKGDVPWLVTPTQRLLVKGFLELRAHNVVFPKFKRRYVALLSEQLLWSTQGSHKVRGVLTLRTCRIRKEPDPLRFSVEELPPGASPAPPNAPLARSSVTLSFVDSPTLFKWMMAVHSARAAIDEEAKAKRARNQEARLANHERITESLRRVITNATPQLHIQLSGANQPAGPGGLSPRGAQQQLSPGAPSDMQHSRQNSAQLRGPSEGSSGAMSPAGAASPQRPQHLSPTPSPREHKMSVDDMAIERGELPSEPRNRVSSMAPPGQDMHLKKIVPAVFRMRSAPQRGDALGAEGAGSSGAGGGGGGGGGGGAGGGGGGGGGGGPSGSEGLGGEQVMISRPFNVQRSKLVDRDLQWGKEPEDDFELKEKLGEGSFGEVWRAMHRKARFELAVKIMDVSEGDRKQADTLKAEIEILKKCRHANIVAYYGSGGPDKHNRLWIFMDLCDGGALGQVIETTRVNLTERQIAYVMRSTLRALSYLHDEQHIVHRDVKAANILLTRLGQVKLADFGVSKELATQRNAFEDVGQMIGSPLWMAPEQVGQATAPDFKMDVWALGITAIEIAEGAPPRSELSFLRVLRAIVNQPPPELKRTSTFWSDRFRHFVRACLQKDAKQRPHARELLSHPFLAPPPQPGADAPLLFLRAPGDAGALQPVVKRFVWMQRRGLAGRVIGSLDILQLADLVRAALTGPGKAANAAAAAPKRGTRRRVGTRKAGQQVPKQTQQTQRRGGDGDDVESSRVVARDSERASQSALDRAAAELESQASRSDVQDTLGSRVDQGTVMGSVARGTGGGGGGGGEGGNLDSAAADIEAEEAKAAAEAAGGDDDEGDGDDDEEPPLNEDEATIVANATQELQARSSLAHALQDIAREHKAQMAAEAAAAGLRPARGVVEQRASPLGAAAESSDSETG